MENEYISFEDEVARGKYSREITELFENNNLNWFASPSPKRAEILIHKNNSPDENLKIISRVSLQIKDGQLSFGLSGYNYVLIQDIKNICEPMGYKYHKKECNKYGVKDDGRLWLTKQVSDFNELVNEFKNIESFLR